MAAEWWFYQLTQPPLAAALATLFEKCLEREWRVLAVSSDPQVLEQLNKDLWTYKEDSFLPHGLKGDHAEHQPILLTGEIENLNDAKVLTLLGGEEIAPDCPYERVMVVFDEGDLPTKDIARRQYVTARKAGQTVRFFEQTTTGGWKEKK